MKFVCTNEIPNSLQRYLGHLTQGQGKNIKEWQRKLASYKSCASLFSKLHSQFFWEIRILHLISVHTETLRNEENNCETKRMWHFLSQQHCFWGKSGVIQTKVRFASKVNEWSVLCNVKCEMCQACVMCNVYFFACCFICSKLHL